MGLAAGNAPFQASKEDFLATKLSVVVDLIRKNGVNWSRRNSLIAK